ncbi:hypothetical protein F4860DRAFT_236231 [Xylaria cubensis]|nr:hypothetical protein F4860DRAFT_236231 [Xylaria cubensis]
MHQKGASATSAQAASFENDSEQDNARQDRETGGTLRNPFEDDGEDVDDDSDDGLGDDGGNTDPWGDSRTSRGGWWRSTLQRSRERFGDGRDDSDSDKEDQAGPEDDEDDEFGDFAMPETNNNKDNDQTKAGVIVKPLPVHPPPHNPKSSAFTSLWPFGSKEKDKEKPKGEESATAAATAEPMDETANDNDTKIKTTHEAARRTSIEDPDDDDEVVL